MYQSNCVSCNENEAMSLQDFLESVTTKYLTASDATASPIEIMNGLSKEFKFGLNEDEWNSKEFLEFLRVCTKDSIIPEEYGKMIYDLAEKCVKAREDYLSKLGTNLFPADLRDAGEYLNAYTYLLKAVYHCNAHYQINFCAEILPKIFNFDAVPSEHENLVLTRTSPFVVSGLYMHIRNLEAYRRCTEYEEISKNEILLKIYARLFACDTIFRMRQYNVYALDECRNVEMISYNANGSICDVMNLKESGSIMNIRPIRLLEKILMNYEKWKNWNEAKKLKSEEFRVAIIGNIDGKANGILYQVEELIKTIVDCLKDETGKINIDWYAPIQDTVKKSYFEVREENQKRFEVKFELLDLNKCEIFNIAENLGTELKKLISTHTLTFFLDCPKLYRQYEFEKKDEDTQNYYCNYIGNDRTSYTSDFQKNNLENNLFNYGLITSLMTNISGQNYDCTAKYGKLIQRVDGRLMYYIENLVAKEKKEFRSVNFMFSSATALSDTDYEKRSIVREERYDTKRFDCIQFDNERLVPLQAKVEAGKIGGEGCIVLTLHQILANINLRLETDSEILKAFRTPNSKGTYDACESSEIVRQLRGIIVGVRYKYGKYESVETTLSLYCDKVLFEDINENTELSENEKEKLCEARRESIKELVKTIFSGFYEPCLMPKLKYLTLNLRYKVDYYNALFSAAANVKDMIYLHLLRDRNEVVTFDGKVTYDENLKLNENKLYSERNFSDKRLYNYILYESDSGYLNHDRRWTMIWRIRDNYTNDIGRQNNDTNEDQYFKQVIGNIIKVCESFACKYRNLYENLLELEDMSQWK